VNCTCAFLFTWYNNQYIYFSDLFQIKKSRDEKIQRGILNGK